MKEKNSEKIASPRKKKKPYQAPKIETEEVFETLALACGKIGMTTFNCSRLTKNS